MLFYYMKNQLMEYPIYAQWVEMKKLKIENDILNKYDKLTKKSQVPNEKHSKQ